MCVLKNMRLKGEENVLIVHHMRAYRNARNEYKKMIAEPSVELFSLPVSTYSTKVRLLLELKGIPYTVAPPPGGYSTPEYMQLVPLGTIPAMKVEGQYLSESDVIMEYIEESYPEKPLLTGTPLDRAKHRFLARYHDLWLEPHLRRTFAHVDPVARVQSELDTHLDKFEQRIQKLEELFEPQPFMVGREIGYADCAFPATLALAEILLPVLGRKVELGPNTQEWYNAVMNHDVVNRIVGEGVQATLDWMNSGGG